MIYQDIVKQDDMGIYTALLDKLQDSKLKIADSYVTAQRLDARFAFENNLKECNFEDFNSAVDVLIAKFYTKWAHLFETFENGSLASGASQTTVYNGTSTGNSKSQVAAYDSTEFVDDTGLTSDSKQNYTSSVYNLSGQQLIQSIYTNNFVYDTINTDIRHTLFNLIYTNKENINENYTD